MRLSIAMATSMSMLLRSLLGTSSVSGASSTQLLSDSEAAEYECDAGVDGVGNGNVG